MRVKLWAISSCLTQRGLFISVSEFVSYLYCFLPVCEALFPQTAVLRFNWFLFLGQHLQFTFAVSSSSDADLLPCNKTRCFKVPSPVPVIAKFGVFLMQSESVMFLNPKSRVQCKIEFKDQLFLCTANAFGLL